MLSSLPSVSLTDKGCAALDLIETRAFVVINSMLGVIMITRLHAMYQQSRKILIFLVVIFLPITIASVVMVAVQSSRMSWNEVLLSGAYQCTDNAQHLNLIADTWILNTAWEALVLFLAVWISIKHFLELRRSLARSRIGDCFTVLIKTHLLYFAVFTVVSFFNVGTGLLLPKFSDSQAGMAIYNGILLIVSVVQMFLLGPRLILSIREYHAKLTTNSDNGTNITTMAFEERSHIN